MSINVFVYLLKLLLKLLDVFFGMRVHFLEDILSPFESINLIICPRATSLFQFHLRLNDVKLLLQFLKLSIVDLCNKFMIRKRQYVQELNLHGHEKPLRKA